MFNYTYPELLDLESLPKDQQRTRIAQDVNRLYGPLHKPVTVPAPAHPGTGTPTAPPATAPPATAPPATAPPTTAPPATAPPTTGYPVTTTPQKGHGDTSGGHCMYTHPNVLPH